MIRTSEPATRLTAAGTVRTYRGLADVGRWFRTRKGLAARVRPIRHREERRVRKPVAAAKPTARALDKKARWRVGTTPKRCWPSPNTLLAELATRCRNTRRVLSDPTAPACSLLTEPTSTRRRVAELVELFPVPETPGTEDPETCQ